MYCLSTNIAIGQETITLSYIYISIVGCMCLVGRELAEMRSFLYCYNSSHLLHSSIRTKNQHSKLKERGERGRRKENVAS